MVSLLKAWYGDHAAKSNGYGYEWLPKIVGDHSQLPMTLAMRDGVIRGCSSWARTPPSAAAIPNWSRPAWRSWTGWWCATAPRRRPHLLAEGHLVRDGDMKPEDIKTEVFLMPGSLAGEKDGTFTNTHRLLQWHDKVVDGPGDSRSELWFIYHLGRRLKELYAGSDNPQDKPLLNLTWDYPELGLTGTRRRKPC